jgi:hypothetical protein
MNDTARTLGEGQAIAGEIGKAAIPHSEIEAGLGRDEVVLTFLRRAFALEADAVQCD